ncbi:MAG: response regulator transcription factor [Desulfuromonadales bacterium]
MFSILIIEDDAEVCRLMEIILQKKGFDVSTAPDGVAGLARLRENRPNLILCDIEMPIMDGHSVLEIIREEGAFADVPFIFVTAKGERDEMRRGMTGGADDYLSKPFSPEELIAAITSRLRQRDAIRNHHLQSACQEEHIILTERTSVREREVLRLVGRGATSKEIAQLLGISIRTVDAHRTNLMDKLGADNAVMLARWATLAEQLREQLPPENR